MKVQVKICGIRSEEHAVFAVDAGADFLGFNFVPSSKRYIPYDDAQKIIINVEGKTKIVGVFQNAPVQEVNKISKLLHLDFVQLHGSEDLDYINQLKVKIIKTINLPKQLSGDRIVTIMQQYPINYFLIDREKQGEGELVDKEKASEIAKKFQIIIAGGLNPDNIHKIVKQVKPFAVDVAGGVETDGKLDNQKIQQFIYNAKSII